MSQVRLGELMLKAGLITEKQLCDGLRESGENTEPLSITLSRKYALDTSGLFDELAQAIGLPRHKTHGNRPNPEALGLVDETWARRHRIIPVHYSKDRNELSVALCDPTATSGIEYLKKVSSSHLEVELASDDEINLMLRSIPGNEAKPISSPADRIPSSAFVDPDRGLASSMVLQDMVSMLGQLHGSNLEKNQDPEGHRALSRGITVRGDSNRIPLPASAFTPISPPISWSKLVQVSEQASRDLEAVFELCVELRLFTREEYLTRLNTDIDHG